MGRDPFAMTAMDRLALLGDPTLQRIRLSPAPGDQAWLVKFTNGRTALGHHEGIAEALYLTSAEKASCQPCAWALIEAPLESGATH